MTLSERLTIQAATETPDSQGGAAVAWGTQATVWAELLPQSASERIQAQNVGAVVAYRFRCYVRPDITPAMRVSWTPRWPAGQSARTLEIHGVVLEPNRQFMLLECGVRQ